MTFEELPAGSAPQPLTNECFPAKWQHFLWRNWGLAEPEKLAKILNCSESDLFSAAEEMGLPVPVKVCKEFLTKGYLTLIRNNWHLLNYRQLLELLEWTPEKMAYTLKEEDFCFHKLGNLKPDCPDLYYTPLTEKQHQQTAEIRKVMEKYFTSEMLQAAEEPFKFAELYRSLPRAAADTKEKRSAFDFNFIHSYAASCGDVLGEAELLDPVPENLMAQYRSLGIKGVWFHALLYLLCPIPGAEHFSLNWEKRLDNLKKIVARCKKYGIRIYLYLNEPRCMPEEFYALKPHWRGIYTRSGIANCTTRTPEVLAYLENALEKLFTDVPDLGGILTITMSENCTNCHSGAESDKCPSCRDVPPEKIIADVNAAMERGMHKAAPEAEMIIYDWAWKRSLQDEHPEHFKKAVMELLPKNKHVHINCVSEWGLHTRVGGVEQYLKDYSISQVGPSPESVATWRNALELGLGTVAKVQINNSWELSAIPSLPVPYLIREHLDNLRQAGVKGVMLSWTLGGYPGGNLELLDHTPEECAAMRFSPENASAVCRAWKLFSDGFRNFPFNVGTIYNFPGNAGPKNPLYLTPTGYHATMVGFPYDDLRSWRSVYPEAVFEEQFKKLTALWKEGLDVLTDLRSRITSSEKEAFEEIDSSARAAYCHLRSAYLQIRFTAARNNGFDKKIMAECAREELELALELHALARKDSRIGFEASNHYFYTLNDLREKVLNCCAVLNTLERNVSYVS